MTLNEDLVRPVRGMTANLSETVETLLAAWIDEADRKAADQDQRIAARIAANDAFVARYGSLADEFGAL